MSTYHALYETYLTAFYQGLTVLAMGACCIVLGWLLIGWLFNNSPIRRLMEWIYIGWCASIYIGLILYHGA